MAEFLGAAASVVTLVSLLTNCVEAFELIQIVKNQDKDLEKLDLKLMLEQCRLKAWGKSMGLIHEDGSQRRNLLDGFEFREVVQQALQHVLTVLTDSNCLSKKYGGRQMAIEASTTLSIESSRSPSVSKLMAAFKRINIKDNVHEQASKAKSTSVWVFYDRKKYMALISEVQGLVDTVEKLTKDIVSQAQQEQFMVSRINAISDLRTLNMVTEVCEQDHPAYSDAASNRADVVSMTTTHRGDVQDWMAQVEVEGAASDDSDDMESWNVTELKRRYLALRKRQSRVQDDAVITESRSAYQEDDYKCFVPACGKRGKAWPKLVDLKQHLNRMHSDIKAIELEQLLRLSIDHKLTSSRLADMRTLDAWDGDLDCPPLLYARALYDYDGDDPTQLSFKQDDIIAVLTQLGSGWWDGGIDDVRGWFPSNHCTVLTSDDNGDSSGAHDSSEAIAEQANHMVQVGQDRQFSPDLL